MTNQKVIFSGASITDSPWYTWKDFVIARYGLTEFVCNAYKGVGNEFIVESTIYNYHKNPGSMVLVMLTNFDKWDWFVEDTCLADRINKYEKHPVRALSGDASLQGYWSTGSWFPTYKKYFYENYYSQYYFIKKTLKDLYILQKYFSDHSIKHLILFDSPIIECEEQTLNTGVIKKIAVVEKDETLNYWISMIDWNNIYRPGLIGFCIENDLKWYNVNFKGHPPSSSHLAFAEKHIFPFLDDVFPVVGKDLTCTMKIMERLWEN